MASRLEGKAGSLGGLRGRRCVGWRGRERERGRAGGCR